MSYSFNDKIQQGLIYLLRTDADFFTQANPLLKPEYFDWDVHQHFVSEMQKHFEVYKTIPSTSELLERVKSHVTKTLPLSEFEDEIVNMDNIDLDSIKTMEFALDLMEGFAKSNAMKDAIHKCVELIQEGKLEETEIEIKKALSVSRNVKLGQDYLSEYSDRWTKIDSNPHLGFNMVLPALTDSLEGGLQRGELGMVMSPPGVGKSLYLANQAHLSAKEGHNVLVISLEMSEDRWATRIDSIITGINSKRLKTPEGRLSASDRIKKFKSKCEGSIFIKHYPAYSISINGIRSLLTQLRLKSGFIPDVIIVDYLELMKSIKEGAAQWQEQQAIANELYSVAQEQGVMLFTATQTNREGKKADIITDAHLGDSYGKARPCDFIVSLNQTMEEHETGKMRVYVVKSRNGDRANFVIPCDMDYNTLRIGQASSIDTTASQMPSQGDLQKAAKAYEENIRKGK